MSLGQGRIWVAPNATEHLAEYATSMQGRGVSPDLVNIESQAQLSSLQAAMQTATAGGIPYNQLVEVGGWELVFATPRTEGQLPALIHALPVRRDMIRSIGIQDIDPSASRVWVDSYVPLSFRSYDGALGARYIHVGNLRTSLLELLVAPDVPVVRGFTLSLFDTLHVPRPLDGVTTAWGLPIVSLPETATFDGPRDALRAKVPMALSFGLGQGFAEVLVSEDGNADEIVRYGHVGFLLRAQSFVGIRVVDLTTAEVDTLAVFVDDARRQSTRATEGTQQV